MFEPGDSFDGWRVEARLGRRMLRCRRETDRAHLAAIWAHAPTDTRSRELLLQRLRPLAGLEHPHLARSRPPRDLGELIYLETELVSGPTLAERGPVPWQKLAPLADALAALHARGTFHGDLRPSRVRLPDRAVLVGFGLVGFGNGSAEGDVYALGLLLYEQLTGRKVPSEKNDPPQASLDPGPPHAPELRALVRRVTAPEPHQRPRADELAQALQRLLPDRSVAVRLSSSPFAPSRPPSIRSLAPASPPVSPQASKPPDGSHETRFEKRVTALSLQPTQIRPFHPPEPEPVEPPPPQRPLGLYVAVLGLSTTAGSVILGLLGLGLLGLAGLVWALTR